MKVFISSVRGGLEAERDALPGLVKAIGHEPVRFEDFTALPEPSRDACMQGVEFSDVYVLLLGHRYGHRFPDTGQSPTHDEYIRARALARPKLVFFKKGETPEPDQAKLIEEIRAYESGSFYAEFTDVSDLLQKVAAALRELAARPEPLVYGQLERQPAFTWLTDWEGAGQGRSRQESLVELHAVPLEVAPIPSRVLRDMTERVVRALRDCGAVSVHAGLKPTAADGSVVVEVPVERVGAFNEVHARALRGVRVDASGQVSAWWSLPGDPMGGILNEAELADALTGYLRLLGMIARGEASRYALAVGLSGSMISVVKGTLSMQSRNSASFGSMSDAPVRVLPDESVTTGAFDRGAAEVARDLARKLLQGFAQRR